MKLSTAIKTAALTLGCLALTAVQAATTYPFTLDNYGRQVEITQKPHRVLTLGPNVTELFAALGLEKYVIGRSLVNHSRGPLPQYKKAVDSIKQLNYSSATREAVMTSGADFIYAIDWEISDQAVSLDEAKKWGMTVYVNSATTLEQQYEEISDIGRIFDIEDRAQAFIADQKARIAAVQEKLKGVTPKKVLVYDSGNRGVFTATGTNFETLLIQLAGGKNIFDDLTKKQWTAVSYEDVLARNPDIILIHDYDKPSVEAKIQEIEANPTLSLLDAVKNKRYVTITLESVLPGDRMAYAVEHLAHAFYPERFAK